MCWSVHCLSPVFFVCLTIIDAFLCFLGHLEHAFPCAVPSSCLTWRPRAVLGCLASSIKLSMCFQTLPRLILPQGQEIGYSTTLQGNIFHNNILLPLSTITLIILLSLSTIRFCFRCYHLGENCSMTISRQVSLSHHAVYPTLLGRGLSGSSLSFSFCTFSPKICSVSKFLI